MLNAYTDGLGHTRRIKYTKSKDGRVLLKVMTELVYDQHGDKYEDDQLIGLDVKQVEELIGEMILLGAKVVSDESIEDGCFLCEECAIEKGVKVVLVRGIGHCLVCSRQTSYYLMRKKQK